MIVNTTVNLYKNRWVEITVHDVYVDKVVIDKDDLEDLIARLQEVSREITRAKILEAEDDK